MNKYKTLLVFLISSLTITGISFIDGKIWNIAFKVVGMIAYALVGFMFSLGLLRGRNAGGKAYATVSIILILLGYGAYKLLEKLRLFLIGLPLFVKILIPSIIALAIILLISIKITHCKKKILIKINFKNRKSSPCDCFFYA